MRRPVLIGIAAVVLAGLVGYHFFTASMKGPHGGAMPGAMPVSVAVAQRTAVVEHREFSGRFHALADAQIHPQVSGNIQKVLFNEGDMVKAGQPLFLIDARAYQANQLQAQAAYVEAQASYERGQQLVATQAISKRELETRQAAWQRAHADLVNAQLNVEYTKVKSPIAGRVGRADITTGNVVSSGLQAPTLTTVQSINPIYVDFDIDEQTYLQFVQTQSAHQEVSTTVAVALANSGENFPLSGRLKATDNQLNPTSASLRARAEVDNPDATLLPGMFARVRVPSPAPIEAVLVNDAAVGTDQSKRFVYVVGADNKAHYQEVQLGGLSDGLRIVTGGLNGGEHIVVNGLMRVHPEGAVLPSVVDMQTLSATTAGVASVAAPVSTSAPVLARPVAISDTTSTTETEGQ